MHTCILHGSGSLRGRPAAACCCLLLPVAACCTDAGCSLVFPSFLRRLEVWGIFSVSDVFCLLCGADKHHAALFLIRPARVQAAAPRPCSSSQHQPIKQTHHCSLFLSRPTTGEVAAGRRPRLQTRCTFYLVSPSSTETLCSDKKLTYVEFICNL